MLKFTAKHFINLGNRAMTSRRWTAARHAYGLALKVKPHLAPIWVQYGHALKETNALPQALDAYRRADALVPDQADTQWQIGRTLELLDQPQPAFEHLKRAIALNPRNAEAVEELRKLRARVPVARPEGMPASLRFIILGTTGICNASCIHCPTGKAETAHVPRIPMPWEIFQKVIDGIADNHLTISDQIAFGLFGDGLVDPHVIKRVEYVRAQLPDVALSVNTNGAAFNAAKHAPLRDLVHTLALHCESLDAVTYNGLMKPLKLERVLPKIEQIMEIFGNKVVVSVPISQRNREQARAIRDWFMEHGARDVCFDPLSSRCAEDRTLFNALALNPKPIRCKPMIMDDLIIDSDGQVLICCQDFQRIEGIGSMASESFNEVVVGAQRQRIRQILAEKRHAELATCSRCFADLRGDFVPA